jgi:hypothetical protein
MIANTSKSGAAIAANLFKEVSSKAPNMSASGVKRSNVHSIAAKVISERLLWLLDTVLFAKPLESLLISLKFIIVRRVVGRTPPKIFTLFVKSAFMTKKPKSWDKKSIKIMSSDTLYNKSLQS